MPEQVSQADPAPGQIKKSRSERGDPSNAGRLVWNDSKEGQLSYVDYLESFQTTHIKTGRSCYARFGIRGHQLDTLLIINYYLKLMNRASGVTADIIGFSGRGRGWHARMWKDIRAGLVSGWLEEVQGKRRGKTLRPSASGYAIIGHYKERSYVIYQDLTSRLNKRYVLKPADQHLKPGPKPGSHRTWGRLKSRPESLV